MSLDAAGSDDGSSFPFIERFDPIQHDVSSFACGNPTLDAYLHSTVERDEQHHTAVAYVLVDPAQLKRVLGYFTLNSFAFPRVRLIAAIETSIWEATIPFLRY